MIYYLNLQILLRKNVPPHKAEGQSDYIIVYFTGCSLASAYSASSFNSATEVSSLIAGTE